MEFFILKQDRKNKNVISIKCTYEQIEGKKAQVVFADLEEEKDRPDFFEIQKLDKIIYVVSERMKELMAIYADTLEFTPFVLVDPNRKLQENYWKIQLEKVDCVEKVPNGIYGKLENIVLDEEKLEECYLFSIEIEKRIYLVASLHFVENFLRKNMFGIDWIRLKA